MKNIIILLSIILSSCSAEKYFKKGKDEYYSQNNKKALQYFNKAIRIEKNDWSYYLFRGHVYKNMDLNIIRKDDYQKAIDLTNEENHIPIHDLASSLNDLGEHEKAIELYKKVIALNPNLDYAYTNLGFAYYNINEDSIALEYFDKSIQINPKYITNYLRKGTLYYRLEKHEQGDIEFKKALKINPSNEHIFNSYGYCKLLSKQYEDAIIQFNLAIKHNPKHAYSLNNRGYCKYKIATKEKEINMLLLEEALADVNKSIELVEGNAHAYKNRALIYFAKNKKKEGCKEMKKAMKLKFRKEDEQEFIDIMNTYCN